MAHAQPMVYAMGSANVPMCVCLPPGPLGPAVVASLRGFPKGQPARIAKLGMLMPGA